MIICSLLLSLMIIFLLLVLSLIIKSPAPTVVIRIIFKKKDRDGNLLINCNNSLFLSPANSEIEKIINSLDANKSTGPNSIPVFILTILKPFFYFWLTQLINLSFEVSTFPDLLKTAQIASIRKKGSKRSQIIPSITRYNRKC